MVIRTKKLKGKILDLVLLSSSYSKRGIFFPELIEKVQQALQILSICRAFEMSNSLADNQK